MAKKLRIAQFYGDKRNNGDYDNGVWMDILKIPFLAKIEEARDYDVIIRTLWLESIGWSKEIKNKFPNVIQIGLSDHPLSTHISKVNPQQQVQYIEDLSHLDGLMALTEEERDWYSVAVPSIPVIKAGLPFPFESYQEKYGKYVGSEKKYIGLGVGASDNDRNFITSLTVFARLKLDFPDIQGVFLSIPDNLMKQVVPLADAVPDVFIHEREGMEGFYDVLSQCKFIINMADRNTPGRLQGEAAFFEVPVIGSNRLELQNELFPLLTVSPYSAGTAYGLAAELLSDSPRLFHNGDIKDYARKKLERYNYRRSKKKFFDLVEEVERRRG